MTRTRLQYALALLLAFFAAACSDQSSSWFLDPAYSSALVRPARFSQMEAGKDPADTVDVLQIFETPARDGALFNVDKIRSKEWLYETSNAEFIRRFFKDAREDTREVSCVATQSPNVLHVLAFDRDLLRVGYLKYYECTGEELGALSPYGTSGLYFSHSVATLLKSILGERGSP